MYFLDILANYKAVLLVDTRRCHNVLNICLQIFVMIVAAVLLSSAAFASFE